MAKNEKMKKSNKAFPNRTFTDEQIKNMSSDDMILSTYQCQFVDKKNSEKVAHQLLRILLRIVNHHAHSKVMPPSFQNDANSIPKLCQGHQDDTKLIPK